MSLIRSRLASGSRGQSVVLFALLLPVFLGLGSIVLAVGDWYVHRRHEQTQVDASVLASAPTFSNCFFDAAVANPGIIADAVPYSGDTARATLQGTTAFNQQVQTPNNVHVIYNSGSRYWQSSDGTDPTKGGTDPTNSYGGLDNTAGQPCSVSYLEAHATDNRVPLLFPWLAFHPSPKTLARVEIREILEESGMLPIAVPENDPAAIYALFVDYAKDGTQTPIASQQLLKDPTGNSCPPGQPLFPYTCWVTSGLQGYVPIQQNGTSEGTGIVILVSKQNKTPNMGGSLATICGQSPNLVACYDGSGANSGLSFIHSYPNSGGSPTDPRLRDVDLAASGCNSVGDLSAPYFTNDANDCSATPTVQIDFNVSGDPTRTPANGGVCAQVTSNYGNLKWLSTTGTVSTWIPTNWSISLPFDGGRQTLTLTWQDVTDNPNDPGLKNNCNTNGNPPPNIKHGPTNFPAPAAAPYVSDDNAGPVEYLRLMATGPNAGNTCPAGLSVANANSVARGNYCYTVAVGVRQAITLDPVLTWNTPDILLRTASKKARQTGDDQTALNGALDCDHGIKLDLEFQHGCKTTYGLNYGDWDNNPATPNTWKDITCSQYGPNSLPPTNFVNTPAPICVAPKGGTVADLQHGLYLRFENSCSPNYWPETQAQADQFFKPVSKGGHDFTNDPRYIQLIVTDTSAFSSPNLNEPIKYFAGFYVTGWDITSGNGNGKPHGCFNFNPVNTCGAPNNDAHPIYGCPPTNGSYPTNRDNGDLWGHYVKFVNFSGNATPGKNLCDLSSTSPSSCVAVLSR